MSPRWEQLAALTRWKLRELTHGFATSWVGLTIVDLGFAIFLMKVAFEEPRLLAEATLTLLDLANFLVAGSYWALGHAFFHFLANAAVVFLLLAALSPLIKVEYFSMGLVKHL